MHFGYPRLWKPPHMWIMGPFPQGPPRAALIGGEDEQLGGSFLILSATFRDMT